MPRPQSQQLTNRETQLLNVLWRHGECSAEQVRRALPDAPHDSTVRTLLRVLEQKGHVRRRTVAGVQTYAAAIEEDRAQRNALQALLDRLFAGSAETLVQRLLEDEHLTPDQLQAIRRRMQRSRAKRDKK